MDTPLHPVGATVSGLPLIGGKLKVKPVAHIVARITASCGNFRQMNCKHIPIIFIKLTIPLRDNSAGLGIFGSIKQKRRKDLVEGEQHELWKAMGLERSAPSVMNSVCNQGSQPDVNLSNKHLAPRGSLTRGALYSWMWNYCKLGWIANITANSEKRLFVVGESDHSEILVELDAVLPSIKPCAVNFRYYSFLLIKSIESIIHIPNYFFQFFYLYCWSVGADLLFVLGLHHTCAKLPKCDEGKYLSSHENPRSLWNALSRAKNANRFAKQTYIVNDLSKILCYYRDICEIICVRYRESLCDIAKVHRGARLKSGAARVDRIGRHLRKTSLSIGTIIPDIWGKIMPEGAFNGATGLFLLSLSLIMCPFARAQPLNTVAAAVIRVNYRPPLPISRMDLPTKDLGFAGATLANSDNMTTGGFLGQNFTVELLEVKPEEAVPTLEALIAKGVHFVVVMANGDDTLAMADAAGDKALIFNALAPDDRLRGEDCRANIAHIVPSRSMETDAVAQFLAWKRWPNWFLIEGSHPGDKALAEAYRGSARKFGGNIVEERVFEDTGGARRTDSGLTQIQAQMPVFTQSAPDHDVVITADENEVFAGYVPYHTWDPRPVVGSSGMRPVTWHPAMEMWGGTQLQTRFQKAAGRGMRPEDYNVWLSLRTLGEAATRTMKTDLESLRAYIFSEGLQLAAFKGQPLNFRDWDHQLRQPVLLASENLVVSVSPQAGFLHQFSQLDTLGVDRPETKCVFK